MRRGGGGGSFESAASLLVCVLPSANNTVDTKASESQKTFCNFGASSLWCTALSLKTRQKTAVDPANDLRGISFMRARTASHPPFLDLPHGVRARDRQETQDQ